MARTLVTGRYTSATEFVLTKEDGTIYATLREGVPFRIDNQMRTWTPVRIPRKNGKGTILVCRKYGERGDILEEFPLLHNKKVLWATTSGAARNGVCHPYREPKNVLEEQLSKMGVSKKVVHIVDIIDVTLEVGGHLCDHCINKWGYNALFDGSDRDVTNPSYVEEHTNQYHVGCMDSTYKTHIMGGTYCIHINIDTSMNGSVCQYIESVYVTPNTDLEQVAKLLRDLC